MKPRVFTAIVGGTVCHMTPLFTGTVTSDIGRYCLQKSFGVTTEIS
jgi:hypothetical protein